MNKMIKNIKDTNMGKHKIKYNEKNIKITIWLSPDGYYTIVKGNKIPIERKGKSEFRCI